MPGKVPKTVIAMTYTEYSRLILLKKTAVMVDARVVNIVRYIPVAVATLGSISIKIRAGTKRNAGPTPQKEATIPPIQLIIVSLMMFFLVAWTSPGVNS